MPLHCGEVISKQTKVKTIASYIFNGACIYFGTMVLSVIKVVELSNLAKKFNRILLPNHTGRFDSNFSHILKSKRSNKVNIHVTLMLRKIV